LKNSQVVFPLFQNPTKEIINFYFKGERERERDERIQERKALVLSIGQIAGDVRFGVFERLHE
jgi:hypothetical protein